MSWNKSDYKKGREHREALPPTPEQTPRRQLAIAYDDLDPWWDSEGITAIPVHLKQQYLEAGLIDDATWAIYRRMVTRGIEGM